MNDQFSLKHKADKITAINWSGTGEVTIVIGNESADLSHKEVKALLKYLKSALKGN